MNCELLIFNFDITYLCLLDIAGEVVDDTNIGRSTALVASMKPTEKYEIIDANYAYLSIDPK